MLMRAKSSRRFFGTRTLRRGDSGDDVLRLQEKLHSYGYEIGEIDGEYGYVTEDAVLSFQRDHRLRADGIVGPQTAYALEAAVPPLRRFHVVRWGERITDIAEMYGVSMSALRWMNGLRVGSAIRPGRRLLVWRTYVTVAPHPQANPGVVERDLRSRIQSISGLVVPPLVCEMNGAIADVQSSEYSDMARRVGWDLFATVCGRERSLGDIVTRRRSRQRLAQELRKVSLQEGWRAFILDMGAIPLGAGPRIEMACEEMRHVLPTAAIAITLPPLYQGWRAIATGLDPVKLSRRVDRILIGLHRWEHLIHPDGEPVGFQHVERWIAQAVREIPSWKVWLGIPTGGCRVRVSARSVAVEEVSYRQAVTEGFSRGVRPMRDESGFLRIRGGDTSEPSYVLQGRDALDRLLHLALKYRLSGIYLHPIGNEDRRLWDVLSHRVSTSPPELDALPPSKDS